MSTRKKPPAAIRAAAAAAGLVVYWDVRSATPDLAVAPPLGCIAGQTMVMGRHVAAAEGEGAQGWRKAIIRYVPSPHFAGVIVIDIEEPDPRTPGAHREILEAIAVVRELRPEAIVGVYGPYQCRWQDWDLLTSKARQAKQLANNGICPVYAASSGIFPTLYTPAPVNSKYSDPSRDVDDLKECRRLAARAAGDALPLCALVSPFVKGQNGTRLPMDRFAATLRAAREAGCAAVMVWGWIGAGDVLFAGQWREAVPLIAQSIEDSRLPAKVKAAGAAKVTTPPAIARKGGKK